MGVVVADDDDEVECEEQSPGGLVGNESASMLPGKDGYPIAGCCS